MKIAYLIVAHNTPNHLRRLVRSLSSPDCDFFIHVDRRSKFSDFSLIEGSNVFFAHDRIPVYWGDFSVTRTIIMLIKQALDANRNYGYFVLLSGSDYPLRSTSYIHDFFEIYQNTEFINMVKMPCAKVGKPISRLRSYKVESSHSIRKQIFEITQRFLRKFGLDSVLERDYKKILGDLEPYGGSTWWALTKHACEYIINFIDSKPQVVDFYKNTLLADEMFFQTILWNSQFKETVKRNLTYTDWSAGGSHPAMIDSRHIRFFKDQRKIIAHDVYGKGELLFARKFSDESKQLVEIIDEIIRKKDGDQPLQHN
jgi:hypothetical protein